MTYRLLCVAAALALAACGQSDGPKGNMTAAEVADEMGEIKIKPGEWETTHEILSVSAPNVPAEAMQAMTGKKTVVRNCVTPEQAAKPNADFLSGRKDGGCTYQDWSMQGGKMRGTMSCEAAGSPAKTVMKMDGAYAGESYDLEMEMAQSGLPGGMSMTITARATGKRIGDCA